jgi:hypothetical protein
MQNFCINLGKFCFNMLIKHICDLLSTYFTADIGEFDLTNQVIIPFVIICQTSGFSINTNDALSS